MTANDVCPDPGTLAKLIAGELSPDLEAKWVRHIDGCLLCQRELEQASSSIFIGPVDRLRKTSLNTTILAEVVNDAKSILQSDQRASWGDAWIGEISRNVQEVGFEFVRVLGKGGMGVVFLAFEASLNRNVAIKVLAPDMAEQDSARERFLREARAAAAVKHPNIITIHAVSDRARLPYLSMEYVEGRTLQQLIDGNRRLAVKQVIDVATQITKALSEAHAAGIVHRDIKPANILIEDGSGLVKVTDFGLAHSSGQAHLTRTGVIVGTPAFLAPEALDDRARYDGRGDLFSLGSVMFAMCCGVSPFESDSILKTLHKIESKPPPSIRERFKDVPAWLEDIIFKLLRKNPSERFQTGEEVLKALQQGEAGQATRFAPVIHPAKPTAGRKSNKKTKKKLPLAWVLVSSLAVFSLIVSAYALTREQSVMEDDSGVAARVPTKERYQSNERSQRRQLASDDESRQSRLQLPTQSPSFFIVENGAVVAELTTLEDAIEESNDGGVIEIRTNETIEVSHVFIETPSLTIAAGAEFRPTLKFVGVPDENDDEARFLMEGDLTLEGLRLIDLDSSGEDGTMLRVLDGSFSATNCEFRSLGTCLEFTDCDGVEIDGCELHSSDRTAVAFLNDQEAEIQMSNSTVSGNVAIWIELGRSTRFTMNQCAIVAPEIFNVWVSDELDFDDLELDELATLSLHDSLLVSQLGTFCFDEPDSESQLFDEWTRWNGNGNVFSGPIRHVESFRFGASEQEDVWIRKFGGKNPQLITDPFEAGEDLWSLRDQPSFQLKKLKFNSELRDAALRAIARAGLPFET